MYQAWNLFRHGLNLMHGVNEYHLYCLKKENQLTKVHSIGWSLSPRIPVFATALTYFSFFHFDVESTDNSNCTESQLTLCESQFNENSLPVCLEVIELKTCLTACENTKEWSSWNVYTKYGALVRKMNSYPDCIPESKGRYVIFFVQLLWSFQT